MRRPTGKVLPICLEKIRLLGDAEAIRRTVEILLKFTRAAGHPHPNLRVAVGNYETLLQIMGRSRDEILATLHEMAPELYGN